MHFLHSSISDAGIVQLQHKPILIDNKAHANGAVR